MRSFLTLLRSDRRQQQLRRVPHHIAPSGRVGRESLHGISASQGGNRRRSDWVHQRARYGNSDRRQGGDARDPECIWRDGEEAVRVVDEGSDGPFAGSGGSAGSGDLRACDQRSERRWRGIERKETLPPTLNLEDSEISFGFDLLAKRARKERVKYCLSNSFGFGGVNVSLLFGRVEWPV